LVKFNIGKSTYLTKLCDIEYSLQTSEQNDNVPPNSRVMDDKAKLHIRAICTHLLFTLVAFSLVGYCVASILVHEKDSHVLNALLGLLLGLWITYLHLPQFLNMLLFTRLVHAASWHVDTFLAHSSNCLSNMKESQEGKSKSCIVRAQGIMELIEKIELIFCKHLLMGVSNFFMTCFYITASPY